MDAQLRVYYAKLGCSFISLVVSIVTMALLIYRATVSSGDPSLKDCKEIRVCSLGEGYCFS